MVTAAGFPRKETRIMNAGFSRSSPALYFERKALLEEDLHYTKRNVEAIGKNFVAERRPENHS